MEMEQNLIQPASERSSEIALWVSIVFFVLATLFIIYVFDNQDNQDRRKIDTPETQQYQRAI